MNKIAWNAEGVVGAGTRMPQFAVSRSQPLAIAIAVLVAYLAAGVPVQAAVNPALDPDTAREAASPFV